MASAAQCKKLFDRFVDLKLSENLRAPSMTSEDRARLRGQIATEALSDGDVHKVRARCRGEAEDVTEEEYRCAVRAPTSKAWNDCIR
jgi:hypothetical protein